MQTYITSHTASYWIEKLGLEAHPEGGFFKRTYESAGEVETKEGTRPLSTSITFLLRSQDVSHFHRLQSDEIWYYHGGSSLTVHVIHPDGAYEAIQLGPDPEQGEVLQAIVPAQSIFGSTVNEPNTYALVGCMVSPGFDYADFELFKREELLALYPQHEEIIRRLTLSS
ncbi:cupin domain-containing protein [Tumebacillus flagellatus]|uniref:Cupin n=1 Tax=Tumebacillus flagellatus TaxID=1157490 RepID=A0A074LQ74_9BACL|nr:cupin domain-containing protein [Tumebacillus flagellatus]KEO84301.1 cupin [Tumebacillus flagellatus]